MVLVLGPPGPGLPFPEALRPAHFLDVFPGLFVWTQATGVLRTSFLSSFKGEGEAEQRGGRKGERGRVRGGRERLVPLGGGRFGQRSSWRTLGARADPCWCPVGSRHIGLPPGACGLRASTPPGQGGRLSGSAAPSCRSRRRCEVTSRTLLLG